MTTYSHIYSIAFDVANCTCISGLHLKSTAIRDALHGRLSRAFVGADWREACCLPDTTIFVDAGQQPNTLPTPTQADQACNCDISGTLYNHVFWFDFIVHGSSDQDGEDLTREEMADAAAKRFAEIQISGNWQDLVGAPVDSYAETTLPQGENYF